MDKPLRVLSLFDGMACARIALDRAGIPIEKYYASEIDKYAIQVATNNYPDIIELGDVTRLSGSQLHDIDLIVAGSPCQGFSVAGKQLNFKDPRSALFFEFVRLYRALKPKWFLLENVKMKLEHQNVISDVLGVEPVCINSALVSAQNRKRLYWTNIPIVGLPEDKGIILEDILKEGTTERGKSQTVLSTLYKENEKSMLKRGKYGLMKNIRVPVIKDHGELIYKPHKAQCLDANYWKGADNHGQRTGSIEVGHALINGHDFLKRVYSSKEKSPTLTAVCGGNQERKIAIDSSHWRKLSPLECERLQTVPDNFTASVSNSQRYRMLGNGFTVDVIAWIFSFIK